MKIILLANHAAIIPAIDYFHSREWLAAVISTEKLQAENLQIEDICKLKDIPFYKIRRKELKTTVTDLFDNIKPDLVFMCGFSYRIPSQLFTMPALGFFNIHFSLLPAYGGPAPLFWQLKNGEQTGGITIHRVDAGFDSGEIVARQEIPFNPGENWGLCNQRYSNAVFNLMIPLLNQLSLGKQINPLSLKPVPASYESSPVAEDLMIQWDFHTAVQIENLVNACNPLCGGALTFYKDLPVRLLEVAHVTLQGTVPEAAAGTIIHADAQIGLLVICADRNVLRINIAKFNEGYFTGFKLFLMGIKTGDTFGMNILTQIAK